MAALLASALPPPPQRWKCERRSSAREEGGDRAGEPAASVWDAKGRWFKNWSKMGSRFVLSFDFLIWARISFRREAGLGAVAAGAHSKPDPRPGDGNEAFPAGVA